MTIRDAIDRLDVLCVLDAPSLRTAVDMAKDALREADKLGGLDRLRELVQADRDERRIIPPVKIGDIVYLITTCKNFHQVLDGTMYGDDGGPGTATGMYCPCELAENCPFPCDYDGSFDCEKHKNTPAIFEDVVTGIYIDYVQNGVTFDYSGRADFEDFGKTVFMSREAAEKALEEMEGNENG